MRLASLSYSSHSHTCCPRRASPGLFLVNLFLAVIFQEFMVDRDVDESGNNTPPPLMDTGPSAVLLPADAERSDAPPGKVNSTYASRNRGKGAFSVYQAHKEVEDGPWVRKLIEHRRFGQASTGLILGNIVLMCAPYASMSEQYERSLEWASTGVTLIFIGEMGLKISALGWGGYWADTWNKLDGSIVIVSIVELSISTLLGDLIDVTFLRAFRMLRVLRMARLLRQWKSLYQIVMTLVKAIPQISNVWPRPFNPRAQRSEATLVAGLRSRTCSPFAGVHSDGPHCCRSGARRQGDPWRAIGWVR